MPRNRKNGNKNGKKDAPKLSLKERMAQRRKQARIRKELTRTIGMVTFFSAVVGLVAGIALGVKGGLAGFMGIFYIALSFKYPRYALWAFLIYLPFGGTITYAIGSSPLLQLAKDGFYIPALIGIVQLCRREKIPLIVSKPIFIALAILGGYCGLVLLLVNGAQQLDANGEIPVAMGILGLKVLLGYVPLILCAYYLVRNPGTLFFLMRLTVILILICCSLAFLQYLALKTGYCQGTRNAEGAYLFKASIEARCLVGGSLLYSPQQNQIRLPGTFVAPWQWGWFLISAGFLTFASAFNDPKLHWRVVGLTSMASVFVMAVLSGQRIALALVPASIVLLLVLTGQVANLKRFVPIAVVLSIALGIAAVNNPAIVQERIDSFRSRWEHSPPHAFITEQFHWAMKEQRGLLGNGLGRATNSARSLGSTELVETYYPKLLYEIGIPGTLLFLAFVTVITLQCFKAYRSVRDRTLRSYGASFWVFILFISYNTYYYPLDVDPVAVYYWFFAGVVLKLPELDRQARLTHELEQEPTKGKRRKLKRRSPPQPTPATANR
ncbi:MAG: hormogonium polysaccharide biosynthesis protein HpsL [Synechococcales bacterium]|nr:hormogonium polysaccharide biosynthesis protein HpsL [Synechococcales bacterium]